MIFLIVFLTNIFILYTRTCHIHTNIFSFPIFLFDFIVILWNVKECLIVCFTFWVIKKRTNNQMFSLVKIKGLSKQTEKQLTTDCQPTICLYQINCLFIQVTKYDWVSGTYWNLNLVIQPISQSSFHKGKYSIKHICRIWHALQRTA